MKILYFSHGEIEFQLLDWGSMTESECNKMFSVDMVSSKSMNKLVNENLELEFYRISQSIPPSCTVNLNICTLSYLFLFFVACFSCCLLR